MLLLIGCVQSVLLAKPVACRLPHTLSQALGLKNLYVQPSKKGTYGYPVHCRTIGGTQSTHMPDAYDPGHGISRQMRQSARAKIGEFCSFAGV
jgi:hypothetical protein